MSEAKTTALAPWFGGKRTLAPEIARELGPHRAYWEVPCGSMAVLFAKDPSAHETVVELHGDLINLAMLVASEKSESGVPCHFFITRVAVSNNEPSLEFASELQEHAKPSFEVDNAYPHDARLIL